MPERKTPSLSEVLNAFRKEAEELAPEVAEQMPVIEPAPVVVEPVTPKSAIVAAAKQVVDASQNLSMEEDSAENAAKRVAENSEKLEGAAEALKSIAKEASLKHQDNMQKEASLFGELFACAVLDEFKKQAALENAQQEAYELTMDKMAEEEVAPYLSKIAEEAYALCLTKLAFDDGYAAAEAMPAAPEQMDPNMAAAPAVPMVPEQPEMVAPEMEEAPEELAPEVVEVPEAEPAESEGPLEESIEAVTSAAEAARAAAEAAKAAVLAATDGNSPEAVSEVAEELPKIAHEAYLATREYLEKSAEENEISDEDLGAMLQKVAEEAYELTRQAV